MRAARTLTRIIHEHDGFLAVVLGVGGWVSVSDGEGEVPPFPQHPEGGAEVEWFELGGVQPVWRAGGVKPRTAWLTV
jgi:hypothetical protein